MNPGPHFVDIVDTVDELALMLRSAGAGRMRVLQRIARLAIAAPRRIIALALLVMVGAAVFGF
jgi:hypothetical protein